MCTPNLTDPKWRLMAWCFVKGNETFGGMKDGEIFEQRKTLVSQVEVGCVTLDYRYACKIFGLFIWGVINYFWFISMYVCASDEKQGTKYFSYYKKEKTLSATKIEI